MVQGSAGVSGGLFVRHWNQRPSTQLSGSVCLILLFSVTLLAGCSNAPTLSALVPADGHPHDVIFVQGDRDFAQIVWDAGGPGEKVIPGGFLGAYMFSVPPGAAPGPHTVKLQNNAGRSNPVSLAFVIVR